MKKQQQGTQHQNKDSEEGQHIISNKPYKPSSTKEHKQEKQEQQQSTPSQHQKSEENQQSSSNKLDKPSNNRKQQ